MKKRKPKQKFKQIPFYIVDDAQAEKIGAALLKQIIVDNKQFWSILKHNEKLF